MIKRFYKKVITERVEENEQGVTMLEALLLHPHPNQIIRSRYLKYFQSLFRPGFTAIITTSNTFR